MPSEQGTPAKRRVLVVEDEALLLFVIADELRDSGFDVLEARNATEAIEFLESYQTIDVVFTDVDMPGPLDGIRLSELVRNRWPPTAIIITSGKRVETSVQIPAGAVFLRKPYAAASVAATINKLLQ